MINLNATIIRRSKTFRLGKNTKTTIHSINNESAQ